MVCLWHTQTRFLSLFKKKNLVIRSSVKILVLSICKKDLAKELPSFSITISIRGNKKDVGVYSSVLIPAVWPSHCLQVRISNVSQPTSSGIINNTSPLLIIKEHEPLGIIHPRRRFSCITLHLDSKLRSLTAQTVTFRKRPFLRPALQTASLASRFQQSLI